ncbi:unnamed protein product [Caenorhabditis auriculariae]|uniref:ubiquitinyl hydrolase 1 n=1 Tax=Caenorhabditis auriculariae TaxID=2777116 RepID=A0A8S1HHG2_9PELO|nr:unnamed protein product [Caenorhabditis auriculariae]
MFSAWTTRSPGGSVLRDAHPVEAWLTDVLAEVVRPSGMTGALQLVCLAATVSFALAATRSSQLVYLTEENWTDIMKGEWMLEFHAPWCPACKDLQKAWNAFADWSKDLGIKVGEVDVTVNPGLSGRFLVTALPTIYHVKDGVFRQYVGPRDKNDFISFIEDKKWRVIEAVPDYKHPNSRQMAVVAVFFKMSMAVRDLHNHLIEEKGVPSWASYGLFAGVTLALGCVLGFLIVLVIDQVFPTGNRRTTPATKQNAPKKASGSNSKEQNGESKKGNNNNNNNNDAKELETMASEWLPLESNPKVINEFLRQIGVSGVETIDVLSFEQTVLSGAKSPFAVLICIPNYKRVGELMTPIFEELKKRGSRQSDKRCLFLCNSIKNACGCFSLFHALANIEDKIQTGNGLFNNWLQKAKSLNAQERSDLLANDSGLAKAYETAAKAGESSVAENPEHHFICYVNKGENLYEIDSRAPFPRDLGHTNEEEIVLDVGAACRNLIEKLDDVSFAALAIFMKKIGVSGLECVDVFSFDEDMLAFIPKPQLAMILCFPSDEAADFLSKRYEEVKKSGERTGDVFFMNQNIGNACGTFALFHSLANLENRINLGNGKFRKWLDKARLLKEDERSDLLAEDTELAAAHEETAEGGETDQPDVVEYHFITYVNKNGVLYEIDSSAPFPRPLGTTTDETLVQDAAKAVKEIMEQVKQLSFSAMLLVGKDV